MGYRHLQNKESNRIKSLYEGLKALNIKVFKKNDGLKIIGNKLIKDNKNIKIKSYYDHIIAMSFLIMSLAYKKKNNY